MSRHISQREAQKLLKRNLQLERELAEQRRGWSSDWPSSTAIDGWTLCEAQYARVETARRLKHAVVIVPQGRTGDVFRVGIFACEIAKP